MRFAAKRTWPDRPAAWEQQGEAENLESFALAFAANQGLGLGTEFMVLDKDSDDATLESFRVTGIDPYTLGAPGARPEGQLSSAVDDPRPPFVASAVSFMFYMIKIAVIALAIIGTLMYLFRHFGLTPPA